jgi:hypothetical protein
MSDLSWSVETLTPTNIKLPINFIAASPDTQFKQYRNADRRPRGIASIHVNSRIRPLPYVNHHEPILITWLTID